MPFAPIRLHPPSIQRHQAPDGTAIPPTTPYPFVDTLYDYQDFVKQQPAVGTVPHSPTPPRVAVVGAGVAGLCAAYELMKAGARPVVYEPAVQEAGPGRGRTRVGGRCYSKPFFDPQGVPTGKFAEMGAMRVPISSRLFYHYAGLFGVDYSGDFPDPGKVRTVLSHRGMRYIWVPRPQDPPYYGLPPKFHKVYDDWNTRVVEKLAIPTSESLQKGNLEEARCRWQALIDRYEDKSFYGALREIMTDWTYPEDYSLFGSLGIGSGGFGPVYRAGFLEMLRLMVNELETEQLFIVSGVGALAEGFYTHVPVHGTPFGREVSLERLGALSARRVAGVEALAGTPAVRLHFDDSSSEDFAACIVATTTRSMQISMNMTSPAYERTHSGWNKLYDPPVGEDVQSALRELHMMNSSKLFILTQEKFWKGTDMPQNIQTDQLPRGVYMLDYPSNGGPDYGVVAVSYTWGDDSSKLLGELPPVERLGLLTESIASIDERVADNLVPAFGEESVYNVDWETEDLYYGAFKLSYPGQDHLTHSAYFQFQECMDGHFDQRVFLAGDSISWSGGWIEGALHTGVNAAAAAIYKLGGKFGAPSPLTQDPGAYTYRGAP